MPNRTSLGSRRRQRRLTERGYEALTMLSVVTRARSSKESLYAWFGNKHAMVAELIRLQASHTNTGVEAALQREIEPRQVVEDHGEPRTFVGDNDQVELGVVGLPDGVGVLGFAPVVQLEGIPIRRIGRA